MSWLSIALMIFFGLVALVLEILVLPGGIAGIVGTAFVIGGVAFAFVTFGAAAGGITLAITFVITLLLVILMLRAKTWRKLMLQTNVDGKMNEVDVQKIHVGMTGQTLSRLALTGKAKFGNEIVEVQSLQDFIDVGETVEIIEIQGNKIIVQHIK